MLECGVLIVPLRGCNSESEWRTTLEQFNSIRLVWNNIFGWDEISNSISVRLETFTIQSVVTFNEIHSKQSEFLSTN